MYYALYTESTETTTGKTIIIDGKSVDVEYGSTSQEYTAPVEFKGNIAFTGGDVYETEYGIDKSKYSAVLVMNKGEIPIDEHSLIWYDTPPTGAADFKVVKLVPSLNVDKYLLQRIEK
jgi:hypothetical protein